MKKFLVFATITLSFLQLKAQDPPSTKVIVYRPFYEKDTVQEDKVHPIRNCIKWNGYLLSKGVFNLNLERMLNKRLSLEIGAGLTYRDFLFESTNDLSYDYFSDDRQVTRKFGPMFSLSMRYYLTDGNLEGVYVEPLMRFRSYILNFNPDATSGGSGQKIGYKMTEYGILFGFQWDWLDWNITKEFYFGAGFSDRVYHEYENINGSSTNSWVKHKIQVPIIFLGGTFGLPFSD